MTNSMLVSAYSNKAFVPSSLLHSVAGFGANPGKFARSLFRRQVFFYSGWLCPAEVAPETKVTYRHFNSEWKVLTGL